MSKKHFIELADCLRKAGMMPAAVDHAISRALPELTDEQSSRLRREVMKAVADELAVTGALAAGSVWVVSDMRPIRLSDGAVSKDRVVFDTLTMRTLR